ncbi:MAG: protein rep [Okeania sp. SIO2D1]|nr:protein rep [Okeania sp. SIO2D1]
MPENSASVNSTDASALAELSQRDKPWDKHRANADKVANHYRGDEDFGNYANRIDFCSQLLDFRLIPDDGGGYRLKLAVSRFCRVRHCPVCQWRRSMKWKAKAYNILPKIVKDFPKHRWLFLTLTVKNCLITELRETLKWMNKAWKRFIQNKAFPAIGWVRSTEVTRGKDGSAHPHFHCLLLVKPYYFSGKSYMKQAQWVELWQKCLRIDYKPILDVRPVKRGSQPMELIPELLKYCVKESDMVRDKDWFLELTHQMHKMRCVVTGGVVKEYLKELEEEPEDLIGDDGEGEVDEGHMYFGWRKQEKLYRKVER